MEPEDIRHEWFSTKINMDEEQLAIKKLAISDANIAFYGDDKVKERWFMNDDLRYYEEIFNIELESLYDKIR